MEYLKLIGIVLVPTILFVEFICRSKLVVSVKRALSYVNKAVATMGSSKISDHWKEKVLLVYAGRIFGNLIVALIYLSVVMGVVLGILYCLHTLFDLPTAFMEWLVSLKLLIAFCIVGVMYSSLRKKLNGTILKGG